MAKLKNTKVKAGYEVGYGKPPKHSQFQPGQSGNTKGRPKGSVSMKDRFLKEIMKLVPVKSGDRVQKVPKLDAVFMKLIHSAMEGKAQAARQVIELMMQVEAEAEAKVAQAEAASVAGEESVPDDELLARMLRRFDHLRSDDDDEEA